MQHLLSADEDLFALARRGGRLSNVVVAAAAAWAFLFVSRLPALLAGRWAAPFSPGAAGTGAGAAARSALWFDVRLWLAFIPLGALAVFWAVVVEGRPAGSFALPRRGAARAAVLGAVAGVAAIATMCVAAALAGDLGSSAGTAGPVGAAALGGVLIATLGWLVQGSAEELLARGWLMMSLGARYVPWFGVVASALLFSSFHVFNPGFGWLPALNLFLIGVFFALFAVWQGCLWGVFALHAAWNWTLGNVLGLSVSGMPVAGGRLLDLEVAGPGWLVGGTFGIEGGVIATMVATAGVLGMVCLLRRRRARGLADGVAARGVHRDDDV